ncbi:MAG: DUF6326 family protein [Bacteroidota bacterium]
MLNNPKPNIKLKLTSLWTALMFLYVYADFFDEKTPASIESFGNLQTPIGPLTPELLLIFSVILIIPSCMIFLSVFLSPRINKWLNIVIALLWSIMSFALLIDTIGSDWYKFYALYQIVEIFILFMIVWQALTWPKVESNTR